MIKNLTLKFGRLPGLPPISIATTPVTVFVGPNNSGKSKVLSEIHRFCTDGQRNTTDVILDQVEFHEFSSEKASERIEHVTLHPHASEAVHPDHIIVGKKGVRHQLPKAELLLALTNANSRLAQFCQWYLAYNTLILDGKSRINLVNQQHAGDLQNPPATSFQILFHDDQKRKEVRRIIRDAFGTYFLVDPTHLGHFRLRLSARAPLTDEEERGIHQEAVCFHAAALPIEQASDGVKAFTGMITEIIAGDPMLQFIDEPEAFLHPSLSFNLGKEIAQASSGSDKRLFVSTHSPQFVMGCIQSGAPVNIVRLTYRDGVSTARVLPNDDILKLMRNPLLRSTGVMSGLFYEFVVVTESDADRAFYQEINERLLRYMPDLGIPNCLFLNAQNKQTVQTLMKPLRELGIPAAGIVDVDVLKDAGIVWGNFLDGGFIPEIEKNSLATLRAAIKQKFDLAGRDMKREGGINLLSNSDKEAASNLLSRLSEYGLFVIEGGELESWLPQLQASGHGPNWLIQTFEKMGDDPDSDNYLKPSNEDVWAFIGMVKNWLVNPRKKGIPS